MSGTVRSSIEIDIEGNAAFEALIKKAHDYIEFETNEIISISAARLGDSWSVQFDLITDLADGV